MTVDVTDHGATGDGTTDDSAAILQAIETAATAGETVWFPPGCYLAEDIEPAVVNQHVTLIGPGSDLAALQLNTTSTILRVIDALSLTIKGLSFDAGTGTGGIGTGNLHQLVVYRTTQTTAGETRFLVDINKCSFRGHTGGQGHFHAKIWETPPNSGLPHSEFDHIQVRNSKFEEWGNNAGAVTLRGPGRYAEIDNCYGRDDGPNGFKATGLRSETGWSSAAFLEITAEVSYDRPVRQARIEGCESFRTVGATFNQMVANLTVDGYEDIESGMNPHWDSGWETFTVPSTAAPIQTTYPPGFAETSYALVQIQGTALPAPLVDSDYYVLNTSGQLTAGSGMPPLQIAPGSGSIRWVGARQNQNFKSDDCGSINGTWTGIHTYRNVRCVDSSPLQPNMVHEQSASVPETATVRLKGAEFDRPVFLTGTGPNQMSSIEDVSWTHQSPYTPGVWHIGAAIILPAGYIKGCDFGAHTRFTLQPSAPLRVDQTRIGSLSSSPTINAVNDTAVVSFTDVTIAAPQFAVQAPVAAGGLYTIDASTVRSAQDPPTPILFRVIGPGWERVHVTADRHDFEFSPNEMPKELDSVLARFP